MTRDRLSPRDYPVPTSLISTSLIPNSLIPNSLVPDARVTADQAAEACARKAVR